MCLDILNTCLEKKHKQTPLYYLLAPSLQTSISGFKEQQRVMCLCWIYVMLIVENALNLISVKPRFVSLPSQAQALNIMDSGLPSLDWPSIQSYLVIASFFFSRLISTMMNMVIRNIFLTVSLGCKVKFGVIQAINLIYHLMLQKQMH